MALSRISRNCGRKWPLPGGFSAIYQVLRAMEESGKVRRGYFVEGLGGAQFAFPGAVDRLRGLRGDDGGDTLVLAAADPANPYGWMLPWPAHGDEGAQGPRRVAGARVVLCGGELVLFLDKGCRRLLSFPAAGDRERLIQAGRALAVVAGKRRGKMLRVESIDGASARTAPQAEALQAAGFYADARGLVLEV